MDVMLDVDGDLGNYTCDMYSQTKLISNVLVLVA
jgi:hypothetical protein